MSIPNNRYRKWHKAASWEIVSQGFKNKKIEKCTGIKLTFHFSDFRVRDLTNVAESVMDLLVDTGVLVDDKWTVTGPVNMVPVLDREWCGCIIEI